MKLRLIAALGACVIGVGTMANAVNVNFDGTMENICTVASATDGALAASPSGTQLDSELAGGRAASVTIVSTGSNNVTFGAPSLSAAPNNYSGTPTLAINYSGAGITQADTAAAETHTIRYPGGAINVNASATDPSGFPAGTYTVTTVVTCAPIS